MLKEIFEKVDIYEIIVKHINTLYIYDDRGNSRNPNWSEIIFFYILPALIIFPSVLLTRHTLDKDFANLLFQAFAIMGGFLINALVLLADRKRNFTDAKTDAVKLTIIEETYNSTAFGVLLCFSVVIFSGIAILIDIKLIEWLTTGIVYYLAWIFIHTLIMVIKRLDKIFCF